MCTIGPHEDPRCTVGGLNAIGVSETCSFACRVEVVVLWEFFGERNRYHDGVGVGASSFNYPTGVWGNRLEIWGFI
jgi:hypothetical protein